MARHSSSPPPDDNRPVDAAVLQYQNQKLVQQIETQKQELHDLESKIKELKEKQTSYDEILIQVNLLWTQLVDDIILLGAQAGAGQRAIPSLDRVESSRGSIPSCPSEDIFLCRLLETDAIKGNKNDE
ncbi:UNVERIFIED_CONTAM: E3 ubiquitin-protein ligase BRE1-like 2 [Sesamum angustifolium]|uniref:E3 ubiquitin protein ligase n=1 Tax=Sesamum angustifolium TaxID=2727405 RepID=A0AAW2QNS8_9LAMI